MTEEYDNEEEIADDGLDGDDQEGDELLKLLNGEPEDGDEDDGDEELDVKDGDSPEVIRTKLAAKNRIIRQREKTIKRMQKELDEKKSNSGTSAEEIAEIVRAARGEDASAEDAGPTIEELKEKFEDDPSMIVDLLFAQNQQLEQKVANVLRQRDSYLEEKIGAATAREVSPEMKALAGRLKARPEYAGFNDEQLLTVAKTLKPLKNRVSRVPAKTSSRGTPMSASEEDVEKRFKSELDAMGYGEED